MSRSAMQELIDYCEAHEGLSTVQVIAKATALLEKQQIVNASETIKQKMDEAYDLGIDHAIEVAKKVKQQRGDTIQVVLVINSLISKLEKLKSKKP